jgi:hypothetical protein
MFTITKIANTGTTVPRTGQVVGAQPKGLDYRT